MKKFVFIFGVIFLSAIAKGQNKPNIEWVDIPAGTFTMGSPESEIDRVFDEVQHQVTVSAFKMSKYEITFEQYDLFCDATGRIKPSDEGWGRDNRPVINVSWNDAAAFAQWMGCRLPTEAEWEYACRAGTTSPFNTGNCFKKLQVNYYGEHPYSNCDTTEYNGKTTPVGSFFPNAFGLYDMHGNVWEWCNDWYEKYQTTSQNNTQGTKTGTEKVSRGGSWFSYAADCRSANRFVNEPNTKLITIGFRIVLSE